jgi:hypothetical protein
MQRIVGRQLADDHTEFLYPAARESLQCQGRFSRQIKAPLSDPSWVRFGPYRSRFISRFAKDLHNLICSIRRRAPQLLDYHLYWTVNSLADTVSAEILSGGVDPSSSADRGFVFSTMTLRARRIRAKLS